MYLGTQISATPRGFVVSSLYLQPVRTKLVRLFYAAYATDQIRRSGELKAIENVLLSNTVGSDGHPISLLSKRFLETDKSVTKDEAEFVYTLLCHTPQTEDTKSYRLTIRDSCVSKFSGSVCGELFKILLACPTDGLAENVTFLETVCSVIAQGADQAELICDYVFPLVSKLLNAASDAGFLQLQKANTNIFLSIGSILNGAGSEPLHVFRMRQMCMAVTATAVSLSPDPLALLSLRQAQSERTLSQRVFSVLFEELMYELHSRTHGLPTNYPNFVSLRAKRMKDAVIILARLGSLYVDFPAQNKQNPLDDFSLFIPSLFGLVKALIAKRSEATASIDLIITELVKGDLLFIKELSNAKLVGTSFEIEQSAW